MLLHKTTDIELIAMCINGNDLGFSALYNKYAKKIYNSIYRIVTHTAEAEDLLQETFCTVFGDLEKLKEVNNFEAWAKRIAINRSISHIRKNKLLFSTDEVIEIASDADYDINEDEIFENQVADVRASIAELSTGYRTILSLYLFEDLSQEDIAKMLNISHNTVRTQYHRAKKKILSMLKDKTYHEGSI